MENAEKCNELHSNKIIEKTHCIVGDVLVHSYKQSHTYQNKEGKCM